MMSFVGISPLQILTIFVTANVCLLSVSGDLEPVLSRCCNMGSSWASNHTTCSGPSSSVLGVSVADRSTCYTAIYICCIRSHRVTNCERGKNAARLSQPCELLPVPGGETHKDCCDGCSLGLKASSMRMPCSFVDFVLGSPWQEAYEDCCLYAAPDRGTSPQTGRSKRCETQNPCGQICNDVGQQQIRCSCYAGYHLASDQRTCEDVNECESGTDTCKRATETCLNVNGGFRCVEKGDFPGPSNSAQPGQCPVGFQKNPITLTCDDKDECALGACNLDTEVCVNSIGSFSCNPRQAADCAPGFKHQSSSNRCIDVDECAEDIHNCDRNLEQCLNSHGGYQCQLKSHRSKDCTANAGFKWNDVQAKCEDVDECAEELDGCDSVSEECRNTVGGYECDPRCPQGMIYDEPQQKCIDVDECAEGVHSCKTDESCVNTSPSYRCIAPNTNLCPPGYKATPAIDGNPPSCVDVDECLEALHTCSVASEICVNNIGSYRCVTGKELRRQQQQILCPTGFKYNRDLGDCADVDECAEESDFCDRTIEICRNLNGSYSCDLTDVLCSPGFQMNSSTRRCEDIDECKEAKHKCQSGKEVCLNVPGGYRCEHTPITDCLRGYKFNGTTNACDDINECLEDRHNCRRGKEMCVNVLGGFRCYPLPSCQSGFVFSVEKNSCTDVDECAEGVHRCDADSEVCVNTVGGFTCVTQEIQCPHGYKKNPNDDRCEDVNECLERTDDCDQGRQYCVNTQGSYQCHTRSLPQGPRCGTGYFLDITTGICKDVDECIEAHPCSADQTCENTVGSYRCLCQQGYTTDHVSRSCKDVNECQLGLHSCGESQRCDNTIGSYSCVRTTSCGTGYTLNSGIGECEDDDECLLQTHNCGPGFICRNTLGSFRCDRVRCPSGQKLLPDGSCKVISCSKGMEPDSNGNCIDINECSRTNACRVNQRCINTVGSYRCQNLLSCGSGYELNEVGNRCIDIDECARRIDECSPQQTCKNRPGGYACECPPGYTLNAQRECEDVDECTRFRGQVCSINSECQNTQGSYICNCREGFKKGEDGKNCVDVDECAETSGICHQNCINAWGSYHCSCQQGYILAPDGRSCKDIDECSLWEGKGSLCIGFCVNEPGSYSCSCPEGYRLAPDKRTCQDVDECQEQEVCKGENEVCLNTRGSFKCNSITCPSNYERDRDHRNRCKRSTLECRQGDADCLKEPLSFSFNFITFVSNMRIPPSGQLDLFTMRGPRFTFTTVQFSLEMKDARSPAGVTTATRDHFHLRRTAFNEAMVSLVKTIPGPQEIELELVLKIFHNGLFGGTAIAKIFVFVTRHEF